MPQEARLSYISEQRLLWFCQPDNVLDGGKAAAASAAASVGSSCAKVLWPEEMEATNNLKLNIPFFSEQQLGCAVLHGPLTFATVVTFCKELQVVADETKEPDIVCIGCSQRAGAVANTLLLVGAFLILERNLKAADVLRYLLDPKIGLTEREISFPTPWLAQPQWSRDSLTVRDCLRGIEAAIEHGWMDYSKLNLEMRRNMLLAFDAAQICKVKLDCIDEEAPGRDSDPVTLELFVAADPVTTVVRPDDRPDPPDDWMVAEKSSEKDRSPVVSNKQSTPQSGKSGIFGFRASSRSSFNVTGMVTGKSMTRLDSCASNRSVKFRQHTADGQRTLAFDVEQEWASRAPSISRAGTLKLGSTLSSGGRKMPNKTVQPVWDQRPDDLPAFARWLMKAVGCRLLVRANLSNERGLPKSGSYQDFFSKWGIRQLEIPFTDGTPPPHSAVKQLLSAVLDTLVEEDCDRHASMGVPAIAEGGTVGRRVQPDVGSRCVIIHCRAGLGRSMVLIGALTVAFTPGLPASSYFGWARMVRPGSIQTAMQERFLRSLDEEDTAGCGCFGAHSKRSDALHTSVKEMAGNESRQTLT